MTTIDTTYIRADETVDTILMSDGQLIYVHHKNGYSSLFDSLASLLDFLNGDVTARWICVETDQLDSVLDELDIKSL
jgi:hypothetical protein